MQYSIASLEKKAIEDIYSTHYTGYTFMLRKISAMINISSMDGLLDASSFDDINLV